jgi:putative IMPACT (imprinted ancient) family translation regulator
VLVVVTRWFGGIKLGAGGLVRAYGGAAAECLRRADKRPLIAFADIEVACAFPDLGAVHAALHACGAARTEERFDAEGAILQVRLPADRADDLKTRLRDATRDRVRFAALG